MPDWSYKVTFWEHEVSERKGAGKNKKGKTHTVRWTVGGKRHREPLRSKAAADKFKSDLMTAHRDGERFDIEVGLPESMLKAESAQQRGMTWYELTLKFTDVHWPTIGFRQRESIAECLPEAALVLLATTEGRPTDKEIRAALREWAYGDRLHGDPVPEEHEQTIAWLEENTVEVTAFDDVETGTDLVYELLNHLERKQDGTKASANYARRKRTNVGKALKYAVEKRVLRTHPFGTVSRKAEQSDDPVDPAIVPNGEQIERLLTAVGEAAELGRRLKAFFAIIAYAGLRPEEVIALRKNDLLLPEADDANKFGEFRLRRAESYGKSKRYTDNRTQRRDRRRLKHRSEKTIRSVPIHPRLVVRIREHLNQFGYGPDDRLFIGPKGAVPSPETYGRVWRKARVAALSEDELARELAAVPYNLRHACVSSWLALGVEPNQVAEWAGHSVKTLLGTYAKCLEGSADRGKQRILEAFLAETAGGEAKPQEDEEEAGGENLTGI
ncbi:tyrosine-type recombinase/integrase [Glycomyces dulcitolivorans]|uniref:tyrosine-type recombinase/integrase n=1 Tax=Glycomyces dulcitolivorans TaxID=2200759 RepID=UPI000DD3BC49|nr:tyrosine-type recombinase/integrase [Glycomyces dulcitolivorans]